MWKTIAVALLASNAIACGTGCYEYNGACACDQTPSISGNVYVKPSDEKPPKSGMPSWQDPGVKADLPQNLIYQDAKLDREKSEADAEGKRAAGISSKPTSFSTE